MEKEENGRLFTIRYRKIPGSFIAFADDNDLEVQEICVTCKKQGMIYHIHSESEEHKGSPHFASSGYGGRPDENTPRILRELADKFERDLKYSAEQVN